MQQKDISDRILLVDDDSLIRRSLRRVLVAAGYDLSEADSFASAKQFIEWATSKSYIDLVASKEGWANVPPGARTSLYENPNYKKVPFAQMTLESILSADPNNSTVEPSPSTSAKIFLARMTAFRVSRSAERVPVCDNRAFVHALGLGDWNDARSGA